MIEQILKTKDKEFQESVYTAPKLPGVYIYRNSKNEVIYVGKAKVLINRVKSYFTNFKKLNTRIQNMILEAESIEYLTVETEVDALILESNLIKKYQPNYNIALRDDKSYIYVRFEKIRKANGAIPKALSVHQDFPRITITRKKKDDGAEYFGPYPETMPAKRILKRLRRLFPYRTTKHLVYIKEDGQVHSDQKKPCFYYHIGLCEGACAGLEEKEHYIKKYKQIRKFFLGEKLDMLKDLEKKLQVAVKELRFEDAAKYRDRINDIKYLTANIRIDNSVDDVVLEELQKQQKRSALNGLITELDFPEDKLKIRPGFKIECYDISNIQGTNAVGSMVVMVDGKIQPSLYRRFKIRMKNEPNDFAMLQEVLTRRFKQYLFSYQKEQIENGDIEISDELIKRAKAWKEDESFSEKPDLIIIDGGKGQLASTYKILYQFNLHNDIPIVGLAKKEEEIFKITDQFKDDFNQINDSSRFTKVRLKKRSEELYLVQRIRDEAHRFAITYHRNLRSKKMI